MVRSFVLAFVALSAARATATDRLVIGKMLSIRDPSFTEVRRRVAAVGKESTTDVPVVSDPRVGGATLTVIVNGGTSTVESYVLDAAGWTPISTLGYQYAGPTGADGDPVKKVIIKRTRAGVMHARINLKGDVGTQPIGVVPPNPGNDGGFILDVAGGDRYCVKLGGAAGGFEQRDSTTFWRIVNATAEDGCPGLSTTTSTTTTTTSTTTTTGPPVCGNNVIDAGEECDGTALPPQCGAPFACQAPGHPDECGCCGDGLCDLGLNIACCGEGVTSRCVNAPFDTCEFCGTGAFCFDGGSFTVDCCGSNLCARQSGAHFFCCQAPGGACAANSDCCSDACNTGTGQCDCAPTGHACIFFSSVCCSATCNALTLTCS